MRRSRFSSAEIQAIVSMAAHASVRSICDRHRISVATFYRWRSRIERARTESWPGRAERERDELERTVRVLRVALKAALRTTDLRRDAVQRLRRLGMSERRACEVLGFARSSMRYRSRSVRSKPLV